LTKEKEVVQVAANLAKRITKVEFSVRLPFRITKRAKWFLASCPVLDIHSQGENEEKAKKNLVEATSLFLTSCFERGTLDEVLKKCGFTPFHPIPGPIKATPTLGNENYMNVPIPFLVEPGTACRA
jgi:predicted RNase H-like HicB family nuclease